MEENLKERIVKAGHLGAKQSHILRSAGKNSVCVQLHACVARSPMAKANRKPPGAQSRAGRERGNLQVWGSEGTPCLI